MRGGHGPRAASVPILTLLAGGPKGEAPSTFLSLPTPSDLAQPAEPESPVTNDGFFPDIDPAHREAARIPTSITWPRLRRDPGRDHDRRAGLARLCRRADRGGPYAGRRARPQLDGQSVQILRYTRAVALYAKAELIERHRDYDLTRRAPIRPRILPRPSANCAAMPSTPCAT
jgi:hypothetical protein